MSAQAPGFIASADINPSTFVKLDTASNKNFHVKQAAAASDKIIGVAQDGTYQPPGVQGATTVAATTGQPITVFGEGEQCLVKVGSGAGVTEGDYLTSDASGDAVTIAFTSGVGNIWHGAVALETANASELVRVVVKIGVLTAITA